MLAFDLISDLHLETWNQTIDWDCLGTSPYCVVAGDVSQDHDLVVDTLKAISERYQAVFYIDGNEEHSGNWDDITLSYLRLQNKIRDVPNILYLQDNVVVINGVAIVGTNGWWDFDFDNTVGIDQSQKWWQHKWLERHGVIITDDTVEHVKNNARQDAVYLKKSIEKLQTHMDVKRIVIVTHTVPRLDLVDHDITLNGTYQTNVMGNQWMELALEADRRKKIHTWCFGHYHTPVDQIRDSIRYVSNCRGRGTGSFNQAAYMPKRIEIPI